MVPANISVAVPGYALHVNHKDKDRYALHVNHKDKYRYALHVNHNH